MSVGDSSTNSASSGKANGMTGTGCCAISRKRNSAIKRQQTELQADFPKCFQIIIIQLLTLFDEPNLPHCRLLYGFSKPLWFHTTSVAVFIVNDNIESGWRSILSMKSLVSLQLC